jgi:hypothetical protein
VSPTDSLSGRAGAAPTHRATSTSSFTFGLQTHLTRGQAALAPHEQAHNHGIPPYHLLPGIRCVSGSAAYTIAAVRNVFDMFPLTLDGLGEAVGHLTKGKMVRGRYCWSRS